MDFQTWSPPTSKLGGRQIHTHNRLIACAQLTLEEKVQVARTIAAKLMKAKGPTAFIMPLAGIVARQDLDVAGDRAIGHYTHEKNPVSCAAGLATIEFIEREGLVQHSRELGSYTIGRLRQLQDRFACIREVRGAGLLIGVELADTDQYGKAADLAEWIMYQAMARGLSFKVSSGTVLTLCPPLVITQTQMDDALGILEECIAAAAGRG